MEHPVVIVAAGGQPGRGARPRSARRHDGRSPWTVGGSDGSGKASFDASSQGHHPPRWRPRARTCRCGGPRCYYIITLAGPSVRHPPSIVGPGLLALIIASHPCRFNGCANAIKNRLTPTATPRQRDQPRQRADHRAQAVTAARSDGETGPPTTPSMSVRLTGPRGIQSPSRRHRDRAPGARRQPSPHRPSRPFGSYAARCLGALRVWVWPLLVYLVFAALIVSWCWARVPPGGHSAGEGPQ